MTQSRTLLPVVVALSVLLGGCVGRNFVKNSDIAGLKKLLAQPNHGGADLNSLVGDATELNCPDCIPVLIQAGAEPSAHNLAWAVLKGNEKVARSLMEAGVDPDAAILDIQTNTGIYQWQIANGIGVIRRLSRDRRTTTTDSISQSNAPAPRRFAPTLTPSFHEPEHPNDYALLVGIEKYDSLPAATYAESDAATATDFVRALGVPDRNIVTLTGSRATRSGLAKQLEGWLANNVDENSTVYFFYSGHGAPDPKSGQAFLVPVDGDPQYLDQTAYPLKRVYERLAALKAKRVVVMLDSCFSGAGGRSVLAKGSRPLVNNVVTDFHSDDGRIVSLTASGPDQVSGTKDEDEHGLFTYYLFSGLNGDARDAQGRVTLRSLFNYVKPKVMDDAHRANRDQIPQIMSGGTAADSIVLREK